MLSCKGYVVVRGQGGEGLSNRLKIGQEVLIHGYVDEIRKDVVIIHNEGGYFGTVPSEIKPSVEKTGHCKDCKWWKDSDGVYRRGVGAESKCPINNVSVNHGFGYCYMYEPQESEE